MNASQRCWTPIFTLSASFAPQASLISYSSSEKLEPTGESVYFCLRAPEGSETRIELYHASTLAPLGVFQHISSKLKLISLANPSTTIELKNSGYMKFEWAFYFDRILKFCWKKDIIGMPGSKRGYTCWMCQKPDSDFPCAIYRPGTSTVPPSCQFLGFNIRRIECLQDPRGLEFAIILALLGFTEGATDHEPRRSPPASPAHPARLILPGPEASLLASSCEPPGANELRVTESSVISDLVARSHKLLEDPLFLYLSLHALTPETFQRAAAVADQIKRDHLERCGEELYQYRVEDMMSQEMAGGRPVSLSASASQALMPCPLKIYLSRTSLDGLLPKLVTISSPNTNKKFGKPFSIHLRRSSTVQQDSFNRQLLIKIKRVLPAHHHPYYLSDEEEQQEEEAQAEQTNQKHCSKVQDQDDTKEEDERSVDNPPKADGPDTIKKSDNSPQTEPLMIRVNELNPIADQSRRNTLLMVTEKTQSRESILSARERCPESFDPTRFRADERRRSSEYLRASSDGHSLSRQTSLTNPSSDSTSTSYGSRLERAESVRSKSSSWCTSFGSVWIPLSTGLRAAWSVDFPLV
ncbi:hypothetical protein PtA15_14A316 [Puccinia triticina]|uniref:Uncharacterized protein n=1 Tax=Puccinia triticina TaxID=208348 RepID=A0ABY7D423_9BASI|nr:uncharacterized protein PtA15_14A316 [Puccinia triticina]WAQ91432.1 hypothetical protein PtA15_14A316 [Puccinia triticina]